MTTPAGLAIGLVGPAWPLDGVHGADADRERGMAHRGQRHAMLDDGRWFQPEPLLFLRMRETAAPGYLGPMYAGGNPLALADRSGKFPHPVAQQISTQGDAGKPTLRVVVVSHPSANQQTVQSVANAQMNAATSSYGSIGVDLQVARHPSGDVVVVDGSKGSWSNSSEFSFDTTSAGCNCGGQMASRDQMVAEHLSGVNSGNNRAATIVIAGDINPPGPVEDYAAGQSDLLGQSTVSAVEDTSDAGTAGHEMGHTIGGFGSKEHDKPGLMSGSLQEEGDHRFTERQGERIREGLRGSK